MTQYNRLAEQYGFSESAVRAMAEALWRGNGSMAQFNHPEFGGSGQWMPGMVMISDMFNNELKARVQGLAQALADGMQADKTAFKMEFDFRPVMEQWWDDDLGHPTTSGGQNDMQYAYFASKNRLAIKRGPTVRLYDTTGYLITGVAQQQSDTHSTLVFSTRSGTVREDDLKSLSEEG